MITMCSSSGTFLPIDIFQHSYAANLSHSAMKIKSSAHCNSMAILLESTRGTTHCNHFITLLYSLSIQLIINSTIITKWAAVECVPN